MSSELNIDSSSPEIIKTDNKDLIFKINKKLISKALEKGNTNLNNFHITSECNIKIQNISNNYVAIRIRTTKKYSYSVDPIYTIIPPKNFKNIKIIYHSNTSQEIAPKGHKFKFEGFIIKDEEKNNSNILELFQKYIKSKNQVKGNTIKKNVIFVEDNNYVMPTKINLSKSVGIDIPLKGIDKNSPIINKNLIKEIKKCHELRIEHNNLIKRLKANNIDIEKKNFDNKNSFNDKIKDGKELFTNIKSNRIIKGGLICLFLISICIGFYFNK